jgi:hypothetical protein
VRLAESAALGGEEPDPDRLDTLAAAYAAASRFDEATATAEEAARLADRAEHAALGAALRERLALYRAGRPYREGETDPR